MYSFNFFRFSWFEQSFNTLKFKPSAFKASASDFYYFQICKKIAWQFKIAVLYFYRFIITFNITLQQVLLLLELNKVRNFFQQMSSFSIPFTFENIKERVSDHLHLLREILYYIISFSGKFYQWKVWYYYILKVFEGNLKNVCQKAIKTIHPPHAINQMFQCFAITLLKWMKYKNRLTFAYYIIVWKTINNFLKRCPNIEISFFMITNPDFSLFFPVITGTV